jgi:hypothetical protein
MSYNEYIAAVVSAIAAKNAVENAEIAVDYNKAAQAKNAYISDVSQFAEETAYYAAKANADAVYVAEVADYASVHYSTIAAEVAANAAKAKTAATKAANAAKAANATLTKMLAAAAK